MIPHRDGEMGRDGVPSLDFKGKQHTYAHHQMVRNAPLIPNPDKSVNAEKVAVAR